MGEEHGGRYWSSERLWEEALSAASGEKGRCSALYCLYRMPSSVNTTPVTKEPTLTTIGISAAVQQHRAVPGQNDGKTRNMLLIQQGRNADCQKQTNCGESAVDSMCPPLTKPACAAANFLHTNTRLLGHGQSLLLRDHQSGCFPSSLSPIIQFAPIPFTQI